MSIQVKAWKCDFCGKASVNHSAINQHEAACSNNPKRRHCKTCRHGGWKRVGEGVDEHRELWCFKLDKPMSEKPYLDECDVNYHPWGEETPVPYSCEHYDQQDGNLNVPEGDAVECEVIGNVHDVHEEVR